MSRRVNRLPTDAERAARRQADQERIEQPARALFDHRGLAALIRCARPTPSPATRWLSRVADVASVQEAVGSFGDMSSTRLGAVCRFLKS